MHANTGADSLNRYMQVPAVHVLPRQWYRGFSHPIWFENETSLHLQPLLASLKRMWKHKQIDRG